MVRTWPVSPRFLLSPDESRAVSILTAGTFAHLDLATQVQSPLIIDIREQVGSQLSISTDSRLLAVPTYFGFVRIVDVSRPPFPEVKTLSGSAISYHSAAFAPDGRRLVTGSSGTEAITVWELDRYESMLAIPMAAGVLTNIGFSPDGNAIGSLSNKGFNLWRVPSWAKIEKAEAAEREGAKQ